MQQSPFCMIFPLPLTVVCDICVEDPAASAVSAILGYVVVVDGPTG